MNAPWVWEIIGGSVNGGILVRQLESTTSKQLAERLATGSLVEEVELVGERLRYKLMAGTGPYAGWVSISHKGKVLAKKKQQAPLVKATPLGTSLETSASGLSRIRVKALSIAGKCFELNVAADCTVRDLRRMLAKELFQLPECIKIILGAESLTDVEQLASHCGEKDAELSLTVVVSLDELYSCLEESRPPASQVMALRKLPTLVPDGCERTITIISRCLESKAPSVRREAVQALLKVAGSGSQSAIAEVEARFLHADLGVRLNAVHCWPTLLANDDRRDYHIVSTMSTLSEDPSIEVRVAALDMLKGALKRSKAARGDAYLVSIAQSYLKTHGNAKHELWADFLWATVELAEELYANDDAIFYDARDAASVQLSRITGALSLPDRTLGNVENLLHALMERPECPIVVYSDAGTEMSLCRVSAQNMRRSFLIGCHRVLRLIGGLNAWKQRGLPVEGDTRLMQDGEFVDHMDPSLSKRV